MRIPRYGRIKKTQLLSIVIINIFTNYKDGIKKKIVIIHRKKLSINLSQKH